MKDYRTDRSSLRILAEALFALNTAFAGISIVFYASLSASLPFIHLEVYLNHLLGIRQTDYIRGYFTFWIPSLMLAVCLLILLRLLRAQHITELVVRYFAGITILLSPSAVWTCGYEQNGWSFQWPYKMIWGEAAAATIGACVFLKGPWEMSRTVGVSLLLGHCMFWYWFAFSLHTPIRFEWAIPSYGGPFGMLLGIPALLIWAAYSYRMREYGLAVASSGPHHSKCTNQLT